MKRVTKIAVVLIALGSLFLGCKKYPEDNVFMEFKKPAKRIVGTWRLTKYYINGADSTTFLFKQYTSISSYQYGILDLVIGASVNSDYQYGIFIYSIRGDGGITFENHKNDLYVVFLIPASTPGLYLYSQFGDTDSRWDIRELTTTDFKITNSVHGIDYRIEFTRQ
ncbi:MAG TPA: hypothetical protein VF411_09745 [Bacteroidia bacterium]